MYDSLPLKFTHNRLTGTIWILKAHSIPQIPSLEILLLFLTAEGRHRVEKKMPYVIIS